MSRERDIERLYRLDLEHLWHPFTQQRVYRELGDPLIIERGEGMELIDIHGHRYLDGVSSLWCNVHGHSVPELVSAIQEQAARLCHSTILGLAHAPVLELVDELLSWMPPHLSRVFFSDSGAAGVEAALRMGMEWWGKGNVRKGASPRKRDKFASLVSAYHGDTMGAISVGFSTTFHSALKQQVVPSYTVPPPHYFRFYKNRSEDAALEAALQALEGLFEQHGDELAAFIIEPLCQGAAGMWIHPVEYLRAVSDLCRQHQVFLIVDEVATGFGKSGRMFSFEHAGVKPDLVVLGKGLTGGLLPLSAVLATEEIYSGFLGEPEEHKAFYYGQTFAGNPLAATAALTSLKLFRSRNVLEGIGGRIQHFHRELSEHVAPLPCVDEVRTHGLMVGVELTRKKGAHEPFRPSTRATWKVLLAARKRGVIIRPLGNVLILMPAVTMGESDLSRLARVTGEAIAEAWSGGNG